MADSVGLHDLIGSLAASIVDAQGVVERHFIALPEGLARVLDIMNTAIAPKLVVAAPAPTPAADPAQHDLAGGGSAPKTLDHDPQPPRQTVAVADTITLKRNSDHKLEEV